MSRPSAPVQPGDASPRGLLASVARLAGATDVDHLLDDLARGVSGALGGAELVVAVRLSADGAAHRAQAGVTDAVRADAMVRGLLVRQGLALPDDATVVDIASPGRWYGRIAALDLSPPHAAAGPAVLEAYAGVTAAVLDRLVAVEVADREHEVARAMLDLSKVLVGSTDTDDVLGRLGRAVARATGCDVATVWRWDERRRRLELASTDERHRPVEVVHTEVDVDADEGARMFTHRPAPLALPTEWATGAFRANLDAAGMAVSFVVPILVRHELLGVVFACFHHEDQPTQRLLTVMAGITDQAAVALDNARLLERVRHQARHDPLTGLPNRAAVEDEARIALADAAAGGLAQVALLFVDLDKFKMVNDTYGHHVGDQLLCEVADRLIAVARDVDTVARLGGDEFLLLCRDVATRAEAEAVAVAVADAVRAPTVIAGHALATSCSVGVAFQPDDGTGYEELLRHADAAMYTVKAGPGVVARR